MPTPPRPESIAQGKRLRRLRSLLHLSQAEFAQAMDYSRVSVNYWENASNGGLTSDGAMCAIEVSKRYGLVCTLDWLLFGNGAPPYFADEMRLVDFSSASSHHAVKHQAEIVLFKKQQPNHVIYEVEKSNAVFPFIPGDLLGGAWVDASQCAGQEKFLALIETQQSPLVLCMIQRKKDQAFFKTNIQENKQQLIVLDKFVEITRWWRPG